MKTQRQKIVLRRTIACTVSLFAFSCFSDRMMPSVVGTGAIAAPVRAVTFTPPPPPPDRDAPGQRVGAASRGCVKASFMALVPEYTNARTGHPSSKVWGTTLADRPTLWFSVPYERTAISSMVFSLEDESNPAQEPYQSEIVPPEAPGVVSVRLPATMPPLTPGGFYHWTFFVRLKCGSSDSSLDSRTVDGWIQRVNPDAALTSQLKQATPQQQVALYAQKGIWFDALTTVGNLRLTNPQDPRAIADWNGLLQSIGLETLTIKPLVPCCKPRAAGFTPPPPGAVPGKRQGSPAR